MLLNAELFQERNESSAGSLNFCFLKVKSRKLTCFGFYSGPALAASVFLRETRVTEVVGKGLFSKRGQVPKDSLRCFCLKTGPQNLHAALRDLKT